MLYKRASSALRDGRHRSSHRLVAAWPRGSASSAAHPAPHAPARSAAYPAARSCVPVSMRRSSPASARRIRLCRLIITGRLRPEYAGHLVVPALKPAGSACPALGHQHRMVAAMMRLSWLTGLVVFAIVSDVRRLSERETGVGTVHRVTYARVCDRPR